ncbi:MAG: hypothetical protein WCW65_03140, partial [Candidatus Paceibacterota bacterium]
MKRIIFDIVLFLFIFILPWWAPLILAIIGLFIFVNFYEFLVSSVAIYVLYSVSTNNLLNSSIYVYGGIIIFYLLVQYLRRYII